MSYCGGDKDTVLIKGRVISFLSCCNEAAVLVDEDGC